MQALVPYVQSQLVAPYSKFLTNPYVREKTFQVAGSLARTGMRYAAKRIQRAWRKRRYTRRAGYRKAKRRRVNNIKKSNIGHRARKKLGDPIASSNCKRCLVDSGSELDQYDTRTLCFNSLTTLERGDSNHQRERSIINVRGIKINVMFQNAAAAKMLFVNFAIVSPKDCITGIPDGTNMFRAHLANRWRDFSSSMNAYERHIAQFNTDRWLIHYHKRFKLAPSDVDVSCRQIRTIKKYIKIGRQLRYQDEADGNTTEPINGAIYAMFWCDFTDNNRAANPTADQLLHTSNTVIYFKETGTF